MNPVVRLAARSIVAGAFVILAAGCVTPPPAQAQISFESERREHPNMARAIDEMNAAYRDMERAPSDFGGQKSQAMQALRSAIISARRALYFRMRLDDNALWRAP
jgi:hypothetical protein